MLVSIAEGILERQTRAAKKAGCLWARQRTTHDLGLLEDGDALAGGDTGGDLGSED
jgi:hypothetical protein